MPPSQQAPLGGEVLESVFNAPDQDNNSKLKTFTSQSGTLPFGQHISFESISGPTYVTAQTLVQQVAYALSDKLFSYSPETFDLDVAVKQWSAAKSRNANGYITDVSSMQTRTGAGSIALGYMFSQDFDLKKRHVPQSLLASSSSLNHLRATLDQLSLLYSVANPFVAHIAAVDYVPSTSTGLVTDYATSMFLAEELGLGLVASSSAYESQHMSLFSTLLSTVLPTIHIYDGIHVGRDTLRVIDVLDTKGLKSTFDNVFKAASETIKKPVESRVGSILHAFNEELGTAYNLFEYHGAETPESVLVVFGTVEASLASQVARKLTDDGICVGVVNVRVYRPFIEEEFIKVLPSSVRSIAVLGQVRDSSEVNDPMNHSSLFRDVLAAVSFWDKFEVIPQVLDIKYGREECFTPSYMHSVFSQTRNKNGNSDEDVQLLENEIQQYTFLDLDNSTTASAPGAISKFLSKESANNVFHSLAHDNLIQGGIVKTDIRSSKKSIEAPYPVKEADVTFVGDESLLKNVGVMANMKHGSKLLLKAPSLKDEDLEKKLLPVIRRDMISKEIELYLLDPISSATVEKDPAAESILVEVAFLKLSRPDILENSLSKLEHINGDMATIQEAITDLDNALRTFQLPTEWADMDAEADIPTIPSTVANNSFVEFDNTDTEKPAFLRDWQSAAKGLTFKEAYGTTASLRPDLSAKTFTVHVKENRRLTPITYDRNIFHIEFDLGDSGLKYDIGEALGIHAENNKDDVEKFIEFYGLNGEEVVEVPSREDANILETRTVYQSLMQNIDIFGKPPKRFYESLAAFASSANEQKELLTLGSPEGANEFKRRAEVDTITYADILLEYQSARPSFHDIARIVSPLKRREYSIASSQQVTPTSVALMIVVVSWVDPQGRDRFGQATRYLSDLPVGASVTVSVKPSVMKLPASPSAPLVMAGLGTGLAPFRAFVQQRALQKAQGHEIGPILLYMGSRHQREEYLYGEEWEAYAAAGVVTLLGRAFSRDQPQKIYIQDRMRETLEDIKHAYLKEGGSFYLCGPTWPVPDVTAVLQEAVVSNAKEDALKTGSTAPKKIDGRKEIEALKEEGRFVLEVY